MTCIDGSRSVDRFLLAENEPFYFVYSSSLSLNELGLMLYLKLTRVDVGKVSKG